MGHTSAGACVNAMTRRASVKQAKRSAGRAAKRSVSAMLAVPAASSAAARFAAALLAASTWAAAAPWTTQGVTGLSAQRKSTQSMRRLLERDKARARVHADMQDSVIFCRHSVHAGMMAC